MTSTQHIFIKRSNEAPKGAASVIGLFDKQTAKNHVFIQKLPAADKEYLMRIDKEIKKDFGILEKIILPSQNRTIYIAGLGEKNKWTYRSFERAVRFLTQGIKKRQSKSFMVCLEDFAVSGVSKERLAEGFASNCELADYEFLTYKQAPKQGWPLLKQVYYFSSDGLDLKKSLALGSLIGRQVNLAREHANTPGGVMTPKRFARAAKDAGKQYGFSVRTLSENQMKKLGMGGVLGVSSGSAELAQFIIMEYKGSGAKKEPLVFIGKGITFDSGGLQIKPSQSMEEMHMDMSGGAAVLSAVSAIAQMKLPIYCIGLVPAVENMPSGASYRPGDLLKTLSGKTIEIGHTDAEGRVILSDALTYAEQYKPKLVVDVATLTGACSVALGHYVSAVLTPQENVAAFMLACGTASGDVLWQLPLWEEYESQVKGYAGDVLNTGRYREAGTIVGAAFLYQFAKKFPAWAHIDIASTMTGKDDIYLSRGASGSGTRLLIEVARRFNEFQ